MLIKYIFIRMRVSFNLLFVGGNVVVVVVPSSFATVWSLSLSFGSVNSFEKCFHMQMCASMLFICWTRAWYKSQAIFCSRSSDLRKLIKCFEGESWWAKLAQRSNWINIWEKVDLDFRNGFLIAACPISFQITFSPFVPSYSALWRDVHHFVAMRWFIW